MKKEMQCDANPVIREVIVKMEETSMETVFDECPEAQTQDPV